MRELLLKAWLRPLVVGLAHWLGIFGGSWATMRWLSRSIQNRVERVAETGLRHQGGPALPWSRPVSSLTRRLVRRQGREASRGSGFLARRFPFTGGGNRCPGL